MNAPNAGVADSWPAIRRRVYYFRGKENGPAGFRQPGRPVLLTSDFRLLTEGQYIPPIPPGPPPWPADSFFSSGISETMASVVSSSAAIDEAFCSAERTTLVGSITPALTRSS